MARDSRMAAANDKTLGDGDDDVKLNGHPAKAKKPQAEDKEKKLVTVKASRCYRLIYPKDEKLLGSDFKTAPSKLGKKAKDYVVLDLARQEIVKDCQALGHELVKEFDDARLADIKIQVGRNVFTLQRHSVAAKEEVKIKK